MSRENEIKAREAHEKTGASMSQCRRVVHQSGGDLQKAIPALHRLQRLHNPDQKPMDDSIYISVDIETDGPIPGPHSMLSLGAAAFALAVPVSDLHLPDGLGVRPLKYRMVDTFSANLEPLPGAKMDPVTKAEFWDKNPEAWDAATKNPRDPKEAIGAFVKWVNAIPGKPVFVGYPAGFDFTFVYHYIIAFGFQSPFSFSALDIKSYASAVLRLPYRETTKRNMPKSWFPESKHTHVAVEDAKEQGELFMNILTYRPKEA
jgi:hypothetical protein